MNIHRPASSQPIPADARLVFKGVIFDVYQWQQKMFDGSYGTFEKLKRKDTALVVPITEEGRIIIASEEQPGKEPFLGLAGGQIERDETVLDAAERELLEETGYKAREWKLWMAAQPYSKIEWAIYILIAKGCVKVADQQLDAGEKITLSDVSFGEFVEMTLSEQFPDKEVQKEFLKAKLDPQKMEEIKKLFFG